MDAGQVLSMEAKTTASGGSGKEGIKGEYWPVNHSVTEDN
jgi:hypothetical protein